MFKVSLELTCQRCLTTTHCLFWDSEKSNLTLRTSDVLSSKSLSILATRSVNEGLSSGLWSQQFRMISYLCKGQYNHKSGWRKWRIIHSLGRRYRCQIRHVIGSLYVLGAEGGGERGKGRGIGRVFYLFLSPAPPLRFLRLPGYVIGIKLTDAFCCSQGLALYVYLTIMPSQWEHCRHWLKILNDAGWRVIDAYIEDGPTHIPMLLRLFYAFFDSHNLAFDLYWTMIILTTWEHCCPVTKNLKWWRCII